MTLLLKKLKPGDYGFKYTMITPTVVVLLVMSVVALVLTFYYSTTRYHYVWDDYPTFVGFQNYVSLFESSNFRRAVSNTVLFTLVCATAETAIGVGMAVFVNSFKRFKQTLRTLFLLPYLLPTVTVALIWQMMLSPNYGIINQFLEFLGLPVYNWFFDIRTAMPMIMLIDIWQTAPFVFLLVYASLQTIPETLYEAARIDGSNKWDEFIHITLPSVKNTIFLCLLLRTIDTFRMFDKINILTVGGPAMTTTTITQYIYLFGIKNMNFGYGSAGSVAMAIFVLILSSVYIRKSLKI